MAITYTARMPGKKNLQTLVIRGLIIFIWGDCEYMHVPVEKGESQSFGKGKGRRPLIF